MEFLFVFKKYGRKKNNHNPLLALPLALGAIFS